VDFGASTYFCEHFRCRNHYTASLVGHNFIVCLLVENSGQVGCSNSLQLLSYRRLADFVVSNFWSNGAFGQISAVVRCHHLLLLPRMGRYFIDDPWRLKLVNLEGITRFCWIVMAD